MIEIGRNFCLCQINHRDNSTIFKSISATSLKSQTSLPSLAATNTAYRTYYSFSSSLVLELANVTETYIHVTRLYQEFWLFCA